MNFKFYLVILGSGGQGRKEGKREIQKYEYLENRKSFLDEIIIFHIFLELSLLRKRKIADTSLKETTEICQVGTISISVYEKATIIFLIFPR